MRKGLSTKITQANIAAVLDLLQATPSKLAAFAEQRGLDALDTPLAQGERSLKQDLVHLINCEALTANQIYSALLLDQPLFADLHPERDWGKLLRFEHFPFDALMAYFRLRRAVLLRVLRELDVPGWERSIREDGKKRQESVYRLARALALHESDHMEALSDKLRSGIR